MTILVERDCGVGVITLNRPEVLNAMNRAMSREIDEAIAAFEEDPETSAIVITGAGNRAFSAGADIHEMAKLSEQAESSAPDPRRAEYAWHIASCSKPTIGAINGLAYGGAAVLAASLDIRVGSENASFRFPRRLIRSRELDVEPANADRLACRQGAALHHSRRAGAGGLTA